MGACICMCVHIYIYIIICMHFVCVCLRIHECACACICVCVCAFLGSCLHAQDCARWKAICSAGLSQLLVAPSSDKPFVCTTCHRSFRRMHNSFEILSLMLRPDGEERSMINLH